MFSDDLCRVMPDPEDTFIVKTDASLVSVGAVLLQIQQGKWVVLEYASKAFTKAEKQYPIIEQEAAAIMFAIEKWRHLMSWQ